MKEKKIFRFCSLALIGVLAFAAGCSKPEPQEELPGTEVILDRNMQNGVDVLGTVSIEDLGKVTYQFRYLDSVPSDAVSLWKLGQWGTKFGLADTGEESQDGDNYILKDDTKEFIVNPKTGQYSLNCNTQKEYPVPKPYGADWLHFITIQNVSDISRISEMENIWMDLDFSIPYCENLMSEADFNMDLHTALFQWVFVVKNCNPDSFDYNQYFWMNIPLYDGRSLSDELWKTFKESAFLDYGKEDKSSTFIYMAPSDGYLTEEGVEVGKRYRITLDLIPYLEKALTTIQQLDENKNSDFPLLLNTTMDDLCINQFYIGWEVPGTFNCGATIYKNSLLYNKI